MILTKITIITSLIFNIAEKANMNLSLSDLGLVKQEQAFDNHVQDIYTSAGLDTMDLDYVIFEEALTGYYNLRKQDTVLSEKQVITVIDFSKPINVKRLYTIDLENKTVLYHTLAAHGIRSGRDFAENFSNINDSNLSSEGFLVTGKTYFGSRGYSLQLFGLDEGINDLVDYRNVVMHPARATARKGNETLAIGRSLGCPSIDPVYSKDVIDTVKDGTMVFIYGKDTGFSERSQHLNQIFAYLGFTKYSV